MPSSVQCQDNHWQLSGVILRVAFNIVWSVRWRQPEGPGTLARCGALAWMNPNREFRPQS
jgi:hypothetical protein